MSSCVRECVSSPARPLVVFGRACVVQVVAVVALAATVGAAVEPPATATLVSGKAPRPAAVRCGHRARSSAHSPASGGCRNGGVVGTTLAAARRFIRRGYDRASSLTWLSDVKERIELLEEHARRAAEERANPLEGQRGRELPPIPSSGWNKEEGR